MTSRRPRVHAPELVGKGGWINTGGRELSLAALRGRIVLLDFWTFCCVNCLHVLDELRELERNWADVLVVVGVHSPKFVHEADHEAVVAAVERHEVAHPVLDDPDLVTWRRYAVRAWPTLARRRHASRSRRACACCPPTSPTGSGTGLSWRTPSTTRCAEWTWSPAGCGRSPVPASSGCGAAAPSGCPRPGTSPGCPGP